MRSLLRRAWSSLSRRESRAGREVARRFDPVEPVVALASEHARGAAWLLATMHWAGVATRARFTASRCTRPPALFAG